jgi:hypothetical protein
MTITPVDSLGGGFHGYHRSGMWVLCACDRRNHVIDIPIPPPPLTITSTRGLRSTLHRRVASYGRLDPLERGRGT